MQLTSVLSESARAEIETLSGEGIILTPEEVVALNYVGHRLDTLESRMLLSRGRPVMVGQAVLWPLTLYAAEWLDRVKQDLKPFERSCLLGYAMAHGRSAGPELDVEGRAAVKAATRWFWSLKCTRREYDEALAQVDAQDQQLELPPDPTGKPMSVGDFSVFLSTVAGGTPDFWERRCSIGYACAVLSMVILQNHADKHPCVHDPRIKGERAMGWLSERIRKRHKEIHG
jgi:hypothetical protein